MEHHTRKIIVGTRQSSLALTQTGQVIEALQQLSDAHGLGYTFELRKIVTKGDQIIDVTLSKVGGKGLFVKEIEQALMDGVIDMAVHSMKDMPYELPDGLINGATPARVDARDCLITRDGGSLADLPAGAVIGTSSLRRSCQLLHARPDLNVQWIRGNIDSRIRKLHTEDFDAIVLAAAGLQRMGWTDRISSVLPADVCIPAVGQGALGIECRADDRQVRELLALYNDPTTDLAVSAERSFLGTLNGGCQVPIGAHATVSQDGVITLTGMVGSPDGQQLLRHTATGSDAAQLGVDVAAALRTEGAERILAEARS
ncbi:hydroxymethylbilane synthase [Paenibacillus sp. 598K]|uniref:hydroxymethylbilane synthase n=1 Tax=Paenibacillus sp. 598K TaxID=1117987 RepID=UPI000FFA3F27|nr:hydroxymethylbilane synthase [Paenibacillus sp. 598K]GBF73931.1 hydroxymethylbilane synthase [Paenibacillus sp. 598K]